MVCDVAPRAQEQATDPDLTTMIQLRDNYGFGAALGWPTYPNSNPYPAIGSGWTGVSCDSNHKSPISKLFIDAEPAGFLIKANGHSVAPGRIE